MNIASRIGKVFFNCALSFLVVFTFGVVFSTLLGHGFQVSIERTIHYINFLFPTVFVTTVFMAHRQEIKIKDQKVMGVKIPSGKGGAFIITGLASLAAFTLSMAISTLMRRLGFREALEIGFIQFYTTWPILFLKMIRDAAEKLRLEAENRRMYE